MGHRFRELRVWQRALDFVTQIYALTQTFPQHELYGLTSQTKRAATSIALNIAEGSGGSSEQEFKRFLDIALRSTYEVMTALEIAIRLDYCDNNTTQPLLNEADEIAAMLVGLSRRLIASSSTAALREEAADYFLSLSSDE